MDDFAKGIMIMMIAIALSLMGYIVGYDQASGKVDEACLNYGKYATYKYSLTCVKKDDKNHG